MGVRGSRGGRVERAVWPSEPGGVKGCGYTLRNRDPAACSGPQRLALWVREVGLGQRKTHMAGVMQ